MLAIPARVIAACFALAGFAAAAVLGVAAGNMTTTVLWRATVVMLVCWVIGRIAGAITQQTVDEHLEIYKETHPVPNDRASMDSDTPDGVADPPQVLSS